MSDEAVVDDLLAFDIGAAHGPLARLLRSKRLKPVFQPIAGLRDGSMHAHEALIRGPSGSALHLPDVLLLAARHEGLLHEFEIACVIATLAAWSQLRDPGRLFLNISAAALIETFRERSSAQIAASLRSSGITPRLLVLELTEHERVTDMAALVEVASRLHGAGVALALDDFGDGRSSLRLWSELKPDIVKIDKYFTKDISQHAEKLKTLRALMQIAELFDTALVAEGIETENDLRVLRDLGIAYGQGYLLGRPAPAPFERIEAAAAQVLRDERVAVFPELRRASSAARLRELSVLEAPTIGTQTSHVELAEFFEQHPALHAVAVVEAGTPLALINRQQFMERYAKPFFKEVYGRRPCMIFANLAPRLIERNHNVDELIGILTSQDQRYLSEGFIITDNGRYAGLGTGDQLVRAVTEVRIEAARHANPLTFLPGNIPISEHMERLLAAGGEFVACYADLNNFKPFNDHYGYWRGDEMIRMVAHAALSHRDVQRDFVGHVGGDDFLILFQSDDWEQRIERIVEHFNTRALSLFDDEARRNGGIHAEDRHGVVRFFPCTTLSVGAVRAGRGRFRRPEQVANEAALAKHEAKRSGMGLFVRDGQAPPAAGALPRTPERGNVAPLRAPAGMR